MCTCRCESPSLLPCLAAPDSGAMPLWALRALRGGALLLHAPLLVFGAAWLREPLLLGRVALFGFGLCSFLAFANASAVRAPSALTRCAVSSARSRMTTIDHKFLGP